MIRLLAAFIAVTAAMCGPQAAVAADAANGETLAKRWCASCHVVGEGQRAANSDVPSFAAIGRSPSFDAERIANFLMSPHPKMPDMSLSRAEAADLVAYIRAQAK